MSKKLVGAQLNHKNNLPAGWIWVTLHEVAEKINPGFPSGKHNKQKHGFPHLRPMNINANGDIDQSEIKYVQTDLHDPLLKGDVLFNNTNSPKLVGKTTYIKENTNWAYSNHMTRIRLNPEFVNPAWIAYALHTLFLNGYFRMNCTHHVNQASINSSYLAQKVYLPLPPLSEQYRIVSKLEELFTKLDAGIEYLKRNQILLKHYRQSVLKHAFEGKLTEKWRNEHKNLSSKKLLEELVHERRQLLEKEQKRYKDSYQANSIENFTIPPEWCYISADQVTKRITDGEHLTPKRSSKGILLLSARNVLNNHLFLNDVDFIPQEEYDRISRRLIIEPGDVLLSCSGTIGRTCLAPPELIFTIVRSVAILKPLKNTGKYICFALQSPQLQNQIARRKTQTAQSNIFQESIKKLVFPLPSLEEQEEIIKKIEKDFSIINNLESTILINLKKAQILLQRILEFTFEGKLISQDPNDEPAEILLERIKRERESTILVKKENSKITRRKNEDYSKQMRLM